MYTCTICGPNMIFRGSLCVCKPGWFDNLGGRCNYQVLNCVEAISNGAGGLQCTKCETSRDTLSNGQCTRSPTPFFIRSGDTFTGSTNNKGDIDFFAVNNCKTLGSTRACADCQPNSYLNGATCTNTKQCDVVNPLNTSACLVPIKGTYFTDRSMACSRGCKACAGQGKYECLSCTDGNYFTRKNPELSLGTCQPCFESRCVSCTGPLANDCFLSQTGTYLDTTTGTTEIKNCPVGCDKCESENNCTLCKDKISLNGVCTTLSPIIANCRYQVNTSSTEGKCLKYKNAFLTGTNGQPYATNVPNIALWANCLTEGQNFYSDRNSSVCLECASSNTILFNDFCRASATGSDLSNCLFQENYVSTANRALCYRCNSATTRLPNGTCGAECTEQITGIPVANFTETNGDKTCMACDPGCLQCQQAGETTSCSLCSPDKTLFDGRCMSKTCGDGILSDNKQCDPMQSFVPEKTCSPDCLYFSSDCPNSQNCYRNIFQLKTSITEENVMFLELTSQYTNFYTYEFKSGVSIWTVNSNTQQILCSLVLPELDDPLTRCFSIAPVDGVNSTTANRVVRIETTSNMMARFKVKSTSPTPTTALNNGSLVLQRRFLTSLALDQVANAADSVPLVFPSDTKIAPVIAVASSTIAPVSTDYLLSFVILQAGANNISAKWSVESCTIGEASNSVVKAQITDSLLGGDTSISSSLLVDQMNLELKVVVTFSDGTTQEARRFVLFTSQPSFFTLLDSPTVVVNTKAPITILLSYTAEPLVESDIQVTSGGSQLVSGVHFSAKIFSSTKRVLVKLLSPAEGLVSINKAGAYTPVNIVLIATLFTEQTSLLVPSKIGKNQDISFWTNLGSDFQYQVFAFSKNSNQNYISSSPVVSNYHNVLTERLNTATAGEQVVLYFKIFTASYQAFYQRTIIVTESNVMIPMNVIPGTTFRDGSNLQSTNDFIHLGIIGFKPAVTTTPPTVTHTVTSYSTGQFLTSNNDLTISKVNYGLRMSPVLSDSTSSTAISTAFSVDFATPAATGFTCLLKLFNEARAVLTATHLPLASQSTAVFEAFVATPAPVDPWLAFAPQQYAHGLALAYGVQTLIPQHLWPIILPDSARYSYLSLHSSVFTRFTTAANRPKLHVLTYDFNKLVANLPQALQLSASWTPAELPVSTYITTLNNSLAAATDSDLLRQLNLAVFTCNQAFLSCKFGGSCLPEDEPIRNMREMLWLQFNTFWSSVPDKDAWQDWTTSVLKNSFLGALTLTGEGITDATIGQIETEMIRDVTSLTQSITTTIAGLSRTHYKIGENLKAVLKVTLKNLELLINTYSHLLRLYGFSYKGFTDAASYQAKMNDVYLKTVILNEAKLLRYTMPADITTFENELILLGGSTILSPIESEYVFNFGDALAVELKNLQFDISLVNLVYLRNHMNCQSCCYKTISIKNWKPI
jgi:hypothetical protein